LCLLGVLWLQTAAAAELAVAKVEKVEVPRLYHVDGSVEAINASTISSQTSGQIKEVLFDVDDLVQAGSVIVVIDDTEQKAALDQARANLDSARAKRANAEKDYQRIKDVYAKKAVAKSVMDKASSDRQAARAAVNAAQAALTQAEQQLEYTKVKAPYTGIVTQRFVEVGEIASVGQQLMRGISLEHLRVNVDVPQSVIEAVRTEKEAGLLVNGQWVQAAGLTVFPVADANTDTFRVRLDMPAGLSRIYPGMYLKVALSVGKREVLVVPPVAVVYRSEVVGVYVVDDDGRVRLRQVRIGNPIADGRFVVLSGLDEGERVALDPQAAVRVLIKQRKEPVSHEE
jgi:RND family efflux transporter MFP subunit